MLSELLKKNNIDLALSENNGARPIRDISIDYPVQLL